MTRRDLVEFSKAIIDHVRLAFALVSGLMIAVWAIPPLRSWLQRRWNLIDQDTVLSIVSLALLLFLGSYAQLSEQLKRIVRNLESLSPAPGSVVMDKGVVAALKRLTQVAEQLGRKEEKHLTVLGHNLGMSWPYLRGWLDTGAVENWRVRLFCLEPEFISKHRDYLYESWEEKARNSIRDVREFCRLRKDTLKKDDLSVEVHPYGCFPAVHGFKLASGDLWISVSQWDGHKLGGAPKDFYEYFSGKDHSLRAQEYRRLFDNWVKRAEHSAKVLSQGVRTDV